MVGISETIRQCYRTGLTITPSFIVGAGIDTPPLKHPYIVELLP